jgi:predicted transcriptional regulator YdeE
MVEIIKVYKQTVGALRFIGKKYDNANRTNGTFGIKSKWNEWFENGWFENIKKQTNSSSENNNAYIGLLHNEPEKPFKYWIGIFAPEGTEVPNGFDYVDFPKSDLGICRVRGKADDVYMNEGISIIEQCNAKLKEKRMNHVHDKFNACWAFERYDYPHFPKQDEKGNGILEICLFMKFYY